MSNMHSSGNRNQTRGGNPANTGQYSSDGSRRDEILLASADADFQPEGPDLGGDHTNENYDSHDMSHAHGFGTHFNRTQMNHAVLDSANLTRPRFEDVQGVGMSARKAGLYGATIVGGSYRSSDFSESGLGDSRLGSFNGSDMVLNGSNMTGAEVTNCDLPKAKMRDVRLVGGKMSNCDLTDASLSRTDATGAHFEDCRAGGASFNETRFHSATMNGVIATDATFTGSTMDSVRMSKSDFMGSSFSGVTMRNAEVSRCNFDETKPFTVNAHGATFSDCTFRSVDMSGMDTTATVFENCTVDQHTTPPPGWGVNEDGYLHLVGHDRD